MSLKSGKKTMIFGPIIIHTSRQQSDPALMPLLPDSTLLPIPL
jgi:hypothetical protein